MLDHRDDDRIDTICQSLPPRICSPPVDAADRSLPDAVQTQLPDRTRRTRPRSRGRRKKKRSSSNRSEPRRARPPTQRTRRAQNPGEPEKRKLLSRAPHQVANMAATAAAMTPVDSQPIAAERARHDKRAHHPPLPGHDHHHDHQRHRDDAIHHRGPEQRLDRIDVDEVDDDADQRRRPRSCRRTLWRRAAAG